MIEREIDKAATLVQEGDLEGALSTLLVAWRKRKLVDIAGLIDDVNRHIHERAQPFQWRGAHGAMELWQRMTEQGQPESERGRALGLLFEGGNRDPREMLYDARGWPDDPRVAAALVEMARRADELGYWLPRKPKLWKLIFERVVAIGDGRSPAALALVKVPDKIDHAWSAKLYVQLVSFARAAAEELAARPPPEATGAEKEAIARVNAALAPGRAAARTADDLLAEVYAHPDDDGPRLVFADFLQERGDPRGEFIALQIAATQRPLSDEERAREAELAREHLRGWLGPLEPRISEHSPILYERGFLAACLAWSVDGDDPLAAHPAWWTLRELRGAIRHPVMRRLRRMSGIRLDDLVALCDDVEAPPLQVEDLEIDSLPGSVHKEIKRVEKLFSTGDRLPRLRAFGFDRFNHDERPAPAKWHKLLATPVGQRLEVLRCFAGCESVAEWLGDRLTRKPPPALQRIELDDDPLNAAWHLHLTRPVAGGPFSSLSIRPNPARPNRIKPLPLLLSLVESLPRGALTELVLDGSARSPTAHRAAVRAATDRLHLQRCVLPWK